MLLRVFEKLFFLFILLLFSVVILSSFNILKFLVVKTGSMQPSLPVNSILFIDPQRSPLERSSNFGQKYSVGDIISFQSNQSKALITHRVTNVVAENGKIQYETKGDANQIKDKNLVNQQSIVGKTVFSVPMLGIVLEFLGTFWGLLAIVILPASAIILHELLIILEELKKEESERMSKKILAGPALVFIFFLTAVPVQSFFFGNASLIGNSLSTGEVFSNVPPECLGIEFSGPPILGTDGNDVINGTGGNDLIFAFAGNDRVDGKGGNDCIVLGLGNDRAVENGGNDVVLGQEGNDTIDAGSGDDQIFGGGGEDLLKGGSGNDQIFGGENDDSIEGGSGADSLFGEGGDDNISGGSDNDILDGGAGNNSLSGDSGDLDTCSNGPVLIKCEIIN